MFSGIRKWFTCRPFRPQTFDAAQYALDCQRAYDLSQCRDCANGDCKNCPEYEVTCPGVSVSAFWSEDNDYRRDMDDDYDDLLLDDY